MKRGCNAGAAIDLRVRWRQTLSVNGRTGIIRDVLCEVVQVACSAEIILPLAADGRDFLTVLADHAAYGSLNALSDDIKHAAEVVLVGEFDREEQRVRGGLRDRHVDALKMKRRLPNFISWVRARPGGGAAAGLRSGWFRADALESKGWSCFILLKIGGV